MKKYKSIGSRIANEQPCSTGLPLCVPVVFNMEEEIWIDIPEYSGLYQVSSFGRIKSMERKTQGEGAVRYCLRKEKILKPGLSKRGYLAVVLTKNKIPKGYKVHRLVSISFIPNPENKPEVNHINNIKKDNHVHNLEWRTSKENTAHSWRTQKRNHVIGERCFKSKLNSSQVLEIRKIGKSKTSTELSKLYEISLSSVAAILNRKSWKHI